VPQGVNVRGTMPDEDQKRVSLSSVVNPYEKSVDQGFVPRVAHPPGARREPQACSLPP